MVQIGSRMVRSALGLNLMVDSAAVSAIASPLTDDAETCQRLTVLIESYL